MMELTTANINKNEHQTKSFLDSVFGEVVRHVAAEIVSERNAAYEKPLEEIELAKEIKNRIEKGILMAKATPCPDLNLNGNETNYAHTPQDTDTHKP